MKISIFLLLFLISNSSLAAIRGEPWETCSSATLFEKSMGSNLLSSEHDEFMGHSRYIYEGVAFGYISTQTYVCEKEKLTGLTISIKYSSEGGAINAYDSIFNLIKAEYGLHQEAIKQLNFNQRGKIFSESNQDDPDYFKRWLLGKINLYLNLVPDQTHENNHWILVVQFDKING